MDFCVVFLMISLWKVTLSATTKKFQHSGAPETTTQFPVYFIQIGRGLTSIPRGGPNVQIVNFGYNRIPNLPPFVFAYNGFVELNTIQLRQSHISSVSHKAFKDLNQLRILDMPGNNISSLDPNTFKANLNLQKLDLTDNKIRLRNRPFLTSTSLETLILSYNRIEQIHKLTFSKLPNLKNLVMNHNTLFFIADGSFVPMNRLVYMSFACTGVYKISENMFENGSYPIVIDLTDSPLASMFNPPLTRVKNDGVTALIHIDKYY